ncbi:MAG: hypothetical protein IJH78_05210 [Clostridia bacterium]|nr:hypothetical protein [Clostridia bacterium]
MKRWLSLLLALVWFMAVPAFGEAYMGMEAEVTGTRLLTKWEGETNPEYDWFCVDLAITNWHTDAQSIPEALSGRLVFRGTYTFEGAVSFDADTIGPLVEKEGSVIFQIPKLVSRSLTPEEVQVFLTVEGTERPVEIDAASTVPRRVGTLEGPGYDTPEEAVLAYLNGLNAGDASAMLSTFAIESRVEHMDPETYISRMGVFQPTFPGIFPMYGEYARSIAPNIRYAGLANDLFRQYVELSTALEGRLFEVKDLASLQEIAERFERSPMGSWTGNVEFVGWIDPAVLSDNYLRSMNLRYIALHIASIGAEDYQLLAAHIRLNGEDAIQTMGCARYDGRWYNSELVNFLANILGMSSVSAGLLWSVDPGVKADIASFLAGSTSAEAAALETAWENSDLTDTVWQLTDLTGYTALAEADGIGEASGACVWAELRFMRMGCAVIDLRFSPAAAEEIAGEYPRIKIGLAWAMLDGESYVETGTIPGKVLDLSDLTLERSGDTVILSVPDAWKATFRLKA